VKADPGVCGFVSRIEVQRKAKYVVSLRVTESGCKHVNRLFENLREINLRELFAPVSKNAVFLSAERAGCHPSCPVPVAALKAVEVAMEMALPREASIRFESPSSKGNHGRRSKE
jgi:hypothetical protein